MKRIISILLVIITISIPFVFWYISIWTNEITNVSDKLFASGLLSAFHIVLSGMAVAMIYSYIDESQKQTKKI